MVQVYNLLLVSFGLANLGQYMKFGLILGGMNRSGLCVRVSCLK